MKFLHLMLFVLILMSFMISTLGTNVAERGAVEAVAAAATKRTQKKEEEKECNLGDVSFIFR